MSKRLRKREVEFICKHLQKADLEAFVVKEVERVEYHLICYQTRQELRKYLKSTKLNGILVIYFLSTAHVENVLLTYLQLGINRQVH